MTDSLLTVRDLTISFGAPPRSFPAVRGLSFEVAPGETLAIVGESGSGKSTTAQSLLGLLPPTARISGSALFEGGELLGRAERQWQDVRGQRIAYVPQNPFGSLNPVYTIGTQIMESLRAHDEAMTPRQARAAALELIADVGMDNPEARFEAYPHQISGGMRQRSVIAMALANRPSLIIADEPTSALDVTVQAQVLDTLERARERSGASLLLITHDLGIVARHADRVLVMSAGRCVESGGTDELFARPREPYTIGLLDAIPRIDVGPDEPRPAPAGEPALRVEGLVKHFPVSGRDRSAGSRVVHAVCDVSLSVGKGETLALVGESGSGKTTLNRTLVRLESPTAGRIEVAGTELTGLGRRDLRAMRAKLQMVLQDSTASLNPKLTVGALVREPLTIHGKDRPGRVEELLGLVGLRPELAHRFPGELSGGQRQRVAIARALAVEPEVLILDEPVSALDVAVQAGVLELLRDLQRRLDVAYVFITHDLGVVRQIADRVAVMYLGRIVEAGAVDEVLSRPAHPYTQALVSAVPVPDPVLERSRTRIVLDVDGEIPAASAPPPGCRFQTRCPLRRTLPEADRTRCATEQPALAGLDSAAVDGAVGGAEVACHFAAVGRVTA